MKRKIIPFRVRVEDKWRPLKYDIETNEFYVEIEEEDENEKEPRT